MFSFYAILTKKTTYLIPMIMKIILLSTLFALITTLGFSQVPNYVPTNGLVGWWPFNGNVNDESGNGNHGVINAGGTGLQPTLSNDRNNIANSAYTFPGSGAHMTLPPTNINPIVNAFTYSLWLKQNLINDFLCFIDPTYSGKIGMLSPNSSGLRAYDGNSFSIDALAPSISQNNWKNVTIIYLSQTISIYINGVLITQAPAQSQMTYVNGQTKLGFYSGNIYSYQGMMDDIGIWNRALTDCEIRNLCNAGIPNSSQTQTSLDSYTWPINNQTYTQGGTYTATIPNAAGCDSTITLNLTMSFTGINDLSTSKLSVYPNPTNGDFTITGLELVETVSSLSLTDMNGKVVKVLDTKSTKFSMASIKPGVYFLNIRSRNKQEVLKIVKE